MSEYIHIIYLPTAFIHYIDAHSVSFSQTRHKRYSPPSNVHPSGASGARSSASLRVPNVRLSMRLQ